VTPEAQELERALHESTGTVTEFLEALSGEPVDAYKIRQHRIAAGPTNPLGVPEGHTLTRRAVILRGRLTERPFVYAESTIAGDRLPAGVYEKLGRSNAPIGRVLIEHHVSIRREALGQPREAPGEVDRAIDAHIGASSFSRAYRIVVDGRPAIAIDEWFLPPTHEALRAR
jgi:chorismate-pyruvate lyase